MFDEFHIPYDEAIRREREEQAKRSSPCSDWLGELEAVAAKYGELKAASTNGSEMHGYWWGARDTAELIIAREKKRRV